MYELSDTDAMKVRCERMRISNKFPKSKEYVSFMNKF